MASLHNPRQNQLLRALPEADLARLRPHLELIPLPFGWAVYEPGGQMGYAYFPTTAIISLLFVTQNGGAAEIAVTGSEGVVGISVFMGGDSTLSRAVVQSAGNGYRVRSKILKQEFALGGSFQDVALRYTLALMSQTAQIAMCNRFHTLDQQLCRWLLMSMDRLPGDTLSVTHEAIALTLGVRREGVSVAAWKLQKAGLIEYRRRHIRVSNRAGLEQRVCECYAVVKKEYDRLAPRNNRIQADEVFSPPVLSALVSNSRVASQPATSIARHSRTPSAAPFDC